MKSMNAVQAATEYKAIESANTALIAAAIGVVALVIPYILMPIPWTGEGEVLAVLAFIMTSIFGVFALVFGVRSARIAFQVRPKPQGAIARAVIAILVGLLEFLIGGFVALLVNSFKDVVM